MAGTGKDAFAFLLVGMLSVDLSGLRPRPTGGQRWAHASVSGEPRVVATWGGHRKELDAWAACGY